MEQSNSAEEQILYKHWRALPAVRLREILWSTDSVAGLTGIFEVAFTCAQTVTACDFIRQPDCILLECSKKLGHD
jgi:hypothetical protein